MACRTMLPNRTIWSFIAGLLTGLTMLYFFTLNERCLYDGKNDDGRNATSIRQSTIGLEASQHSQRDLHNDLEDGRIPSKGTFLSLLNIKIVSLVMERIKQHKTLLYNQEMTICQTTDQWI